MSLQVQIAELPKRLQEEWCDKSRYYSDKKDVEVFEEFKQSWESFQGPVVEEFLSVSNSVYIQWKNWKSINRYYTGFKNKTLMQVWNEFKLFWQLETEESKIMFEEMELLSKNMLHEWYFKYEFHYPHVYEERQSWANYHLKSKAQLWDEFKEIWEIDLDNYNEFKYEEMMEFVNKIKGSRKFFSYCENANYHSFDSYSLFEKFEICEQFDAENDS